MHPELYPLAPRDDGTRRDFAAGGKIQSPDQDHDALQDVRYVLTQRAEDLLARWAAERWLFGRELS